MATIILSHDVKDVSVWKPIYVADAPRRAKAGLVELAVGTKSDNPNKVFMVWKGDPLAVDKMLHDPDLAEVMKAAGVISAPELTVINS